MKRKHFWDRAVRHNACRKHWVSPVTFSTRGWNQRTEKCFSEYLSTMRNKWMTYCWHLWLNKGVGERGKKIFTPPTQYKCQKSKFLPFFLSANTRKKNLFRLESIFVNLVKYMVSIHGIRSFIQ